MTEGVSTLRAVVVDDEQLARDEVCFLLSEIGGVEVVGQASDGLEALQVIESENPDLVMLDVVMPQPDGYAVCRRIREREDTAMLPVIMITASTSERTEAIRAGADDLIAKPFDQDELLARNRKPDPLQAATGAGMP